MTEFDLYLNDKRPAIGLYVAQGAGLPDLADKADWLFNGTFTQGQLALAVIEGVEKDGHAFRDMD